MKLSAKNLLISSDFFCFVCCFITPSLLLSSLVTAISEDKDNDIVIVGEDSLTHPSLRSQWQTNHEKLPISLYNQIPEKYFRAKEQIRNWIDFHKRKMDEQPPPGFVGARGRRDRQKSFDYRYVDGRRYPTDAYKTLNEAFPHLWPHIKEDQNIEPVTEELMAARLSSDKKSDNIVYKDGFLGVRG